MKGKAFLHHTMQMMDTQPWKYVGFVCFPNLENKEALKEAGVVHDGNELKVLIKQDEI